MGVHLTQRDIAFKFASWVSVNLNCIWSGSSKRPKRKSKTATIGVVGETWIVQNQLSYPYRCHQAEPHTRGINSAADFDGLCQRGRCAEYGIIWDDRKMRRDAHPEMKGNIRDYASINELICLSNLENLNAVLIDENIPQSERLTKLNEIAIHQMKILNDTESRHLLKWRQR